MTDERTCDHQLAVFSIDCDRFRAPQRNIFSHRLHKRFDHFVSRKNLLVLIDNLANVFRNRIILGGYCTVCNVADLTGLMKLSGNFQTSGSKVPTEMADQERVRSLVNVSLGFRLVMASRTIARSSTVFVNGPAESKFAETGTIPAWDTSPIVGFNEYSAALPAGQIRDPSVSVPIEIGA